MFCDTSATNSCARCSPHSVCPTGMVVKFQGTAQRDTVCEPPSPTVATPDCSASPQDCKAPSSSTTPQVKPTLTSPASSDARTPLFEGGTSLTPEDASKMTANSTSSVGKLNPEPGLTLQQLCPQGSANCRKQCDPEYYLDRDGRCTACVSCSGDDLVEKRPCSWNSSRVCECRAGMFCDTSATNSCARCSPHSVCPTGMVVKFQASSDARTPLFGGGTSLTPEDASKMTPNSTSSMGKLNPEPGLTLQQLCPQGSANCRKQCDPEYYLDRDGRCTACVSCSGGHLVEKAPCTWNASRVCECRPGMFCATSVTDSCAHCVTRPTCPPGTVADLQGTAERDTTYEPPPPGTHPNCSTNPEDSGAPASPTPSLISLADSLTGKERGSGITHARGHASISTSAPISFSSTGKPTLVSGPVLFWVILTLVVVVSFSSFLLCHRRACRKWIGQKLHLCYPVQAFRPKPEPMDSRPRRNLTLTKSLSVTEPGSEEQGLLSSPAVETCPNLESLRLLEANPASSPSTPTDLPEPRGTMEHTNNRIENIYIMKADTVIVGTVKAEVPEVQGPVGLPGPEFEEDLEVDHAPHYPEQETEPPLGNCGDVMFSVEEEGKEDPLPTTVSGK
ncbi:tumor necrosis factor receptor superfamily member 8 [Hippopotamus amphibius kiboko]|uniref:tumor necrosis factor receptor superfamily member 8 n=1 Tax=Hippopotamus amphibius kiboko TaxID=575201 RepID=UPI002597C059|nr:tumor necrosis factor receptor superfamily member 8 [Hippopotamus amphibius kiboko]